MAVGPRDSRSGPVVGSLSAALERVVPWLWVLWRGSLRMGPGRRHCLGAQGCQCRGT
jgi:hypothetical protein